MTSYDIFYRRRFFAGAFRFAALRFGAAFFFEAAFRFGALRLAAALRLVAITKNASCLFFYSNTKQNYTN